MKTRWKIGTRASALALTQAQWVRDRLAEKFPAEHWELRVIKTAGDRRGAKAANQVLSKGIFTREIEEALLAGQIDLAVHSLKDLPVDLPNGLVLGPVPLREDPRDGLVSLDNMPLSRLRRGARVGTGSDRRKWQILALRPDLEVLTIHGNVQTRVRRVAKNDLDGVVLACAGLRRLELQGHFAEIFEPAQMLPAVGQGALALELRQDAAALLTRLEHVQDIDTDLCVRAERALLGALGGGCRVPIGGMARRADGLMTIWGGVFSSDGKKNLRREKCGRVSDVAEAQAMGRSVAQDLLDQGAAEMLNLEN